MSSATNKQTQWQLERRRQRYIKGTICFVGLMILLISLATIHHYRATKHVHSEKITHQPLVFSQEIAKMPNKGQLVYEHFCINCHAPNPQINVGAPRFRNKRDWSKRKKTPEAFLKGLENNRGLMPPRGGCFECDDASLLASIEYMLK